MDLGVKKGKRTGIGNQGKEYKMIEEGKDLGLSLLEAGMLIPRYHGDTLVLFVSVSSHNRYVLLLANQLSNWQLFRLSRTPTWIFNLSFFSCFLTFPTFQ